MPVDKVTIKIPRPLYNRIRQITEESGFDSPTDFIVHVLRDLVGEIQVTSNTNGLTEEEIKIVKNRLKSLGYL